MRSVDSALFVVLTLNSEDLTEDQSVLSHRTPQLSGSAIVLGVRTLVIISSYTTCNQRTDEVGTQWSQGEIPIYILHYLVSFQFI